MLEGQVVELREVRDVNTVLTQLADMATEAKARGKTAPIYDLCQLSVARFDLFCGDQLRSDEYPRGIPRHEMPQLEGKPVPGSPADSLPRNPWDSTEVDGSAEFIEYLRSAGVGVSLEVLPAVSLKASQCELLGPVAAALMVDANFDPARNPVFISRDNYLVDGHHRWAAVVGRDAADGMLGESTVDAVRVDAPIWEVLRIANRWAAAFGIQQAGSSPVTRFPSGVRRRCPSAANRWRRRAPLRRRGPSGLNRGVRLPLVPLFHGDRAPSCRQP
jgi:hypothetical protein